MKLHLLAAAGFHQASIKEAAREGSGPVTRALEGTRSALGSFKQVTATAVVHVGEGASSATNAAAAAANSSAASAAGGCIVQ